VQGDLSPVAVAADDVGRALGWLDARTIAFTRLLPGDLPEERPWAVDLVTGAIRPLLSDARGHVYGLSLLGGRLYFARTLAPVVTLPRPEDEVELVQREARSDLERVVVRERGALPLAVRLEGRRLIFQDDGAFTLSAFDVDSGKISPWGSDRPGSAPPPSPSPGGDLAMPYIHQVYDTPDDFAGGWACGPTSTLMCVLHYGRLQPWPITASTPYSHTSDYGAYDAYTYTAYGSTFDRVQDDARGSPATGAYGWCTDGGAAWAYRMQDYAQRHNLSSDFYSPSSFGDVQAAIDDGKTVALSTYLTSAGHIIAIKGYTTDGRLVANDPYGDKNQGYMNYAGEGAVYTWAQVNSSWFITVYGTVTPTNKPPVGSLDAVGCDQVAGWSQDPDEPDKAIDVHVYFGGAAGSGAPGIPLNAGDARADLCTAIGSCNHGFHLRSALSLFDGAAHEVHAYGIDSQGGANAELGGSPKTLQCPSSPPAGVKRHVTDPTVYAAWGFSDVMDVMPVSDAQLAALPDEVDIAPAPVMVRGDGEPAVYILDHGYKRHVPSPEVAMNWHLDLAQVQVKPPAEVDAYPETTALRDRPVLVKGPGPAVYLVDDALPGADAGMAGPDAAAPGPDAAAAGPDASSARPDAGSTIVRADASEQPLPVAMDGSVVAPSPGADAGRARGTDAGHVPGADNVNAGCGCASTGSASSVMLSLALLALGALRRRSRPRAV
jgi:MYXO-CTERM domain-containing protein